MSIDDFENVPTANGELKPDEGIEISGSATPLNVDDAKATKFAEVAMKKNVPNFESYLVANFKNNIIDYVLRCHHNEIATTFYIHPANVSGETLDFEVSNNVLFEPLRLPSSHTSNELTYEQHIGLDLNFAVAHVHGLNVKAGWWSDLATGERKDRNVGELLCLVHSEISEAMEGHRKNQMDDKLPHRKMIEVELADAVIRILDIAGGLGLDLGGALTEKLQFNAQRADHKVENRIKEDGKKY